MFSVFSIILLILLGIVLLFIEFFIIPGISIPGIAGTVLVVGGITTAFIGYGAATGSLVLAITAILFIIMFYFSLKSKTWRKMTLNTELKGKANVIEEGSIKPGDTGKCISRLAPGGKVLINDQVLEARSFSGFVDENTIIEVIKLEGTKIIVKPINQ
jgi:membrane-bound ClpP family serine protease